MINKKSLFFGGGSLVCIIMLTILFIFCGINIFRSDKEKNIKTTKENFIQFGIVFILVTIFIIGLFICLISFYRNNNKSEDSSVISSRSQKSETLVNTELIDESHEKDDIITSLTRRNSFNKVEAEAIKEADEKTIKEADEKTIKEADEKLQNSKIEIPPESHKIKIYRTVFKNKNEIGDFSWMIKQDKYKDCLYVYTANEENSGPYSKKKGSNSAEVATDKNSFGIPYGILTSFGKDTKYKLSYEDNFNPSDNDVFGHEIKDELNKNKKRTLEEHIDIYIDYLIWFALHNGYYNIIIPSVSTKVNDKIGARQWAFRRDIIGYEPNALDFFNEMSDKIILTLIGKLNIDPNSDLDVNDIISPKNITYTSKNSTVIVKNNDDKYLIVKDNNNHWCSPGGIIDGKETPIQGGIRELFEETGIKAYNNIDGEFIMDGNNPLILENVGKVYVLLFKYNGKDNAIKLSSEHKDFNWETYDNLIKRSDIRYCCKDTFRKFNPINFK